MYKKNSSSTLAAQGAGEMCMEEGLFRPVLLAWAAVQSETLGHKACRKIGIGALIRKLREGLVANDGSELQADRRDAANFLERHCRACGKCKEMRAPDVIAHHR